MTHRLTWLFIIAMFFVIGCQPRDRQETNIRPEKQSTTTQSANEETFKAILAANTAIDMPYEDEFITRFIYIRDSRPCPDICYGLYIMASRPDSHDAWGGPGLATVNCKQVQHLLINPDPSPIEEDCEQLFKQLKDQQAPPMPSQPQP